MFLFNSTYIFDCKTVKKCICQLSVNKTKPRATHANFHSILRRRAGSRLCERPINCQLFALKKRLKNKLRWCCINSIACSLDCIYVWRRTYWKNIILWCIKARQKKTIKIINVLHWYFHLICFYFIHFKYSETFLVIHSMNENVLKQKTSIKRATNLKKCMKIVMYQNHFNWNKLIRIELFFFVFILVHLCDVLNNMLN